MSANIKGVELMTYMADSQQGATQLFILTFTEENMKITTILVTLSCSTPAVSCCSLALFFLLAIFIKFSFK